MGFGDDSTAARRIQALRRWWHYIKDIGPMFGYFSNAVKTSLVVILKFIEEASKIFEGTGIELTTEGQTLLGSAVGTVSFVREDVTDKVME